MKYFRRIISAILVTAMLLSMSLTAFAATSTATKVNMTVTDSEGNAVSEVKVGDTIKLELTADGEITSVGAGITVEYDNTVLELDAANSTAAGELQVKTGSGNVKATCTPNEDSPFTIASGDSIAVFVFKAIAAAESTGFTMSELSVYETATEKLALTFPEAITLSVTEVYDCETDGHQYSEGVCTVCGEAEPAVPSVTVNFSISSDANYLLGDATGEVMALKEITVPYFDLALYGLEQFYFSSETYGDDGDGLPGSDLEPGTAEFAYGKVTLLHLFIYALEVYHCGLNEEDAGQGYLYDQGLMDTEVLSVGGSQGSAFLNYIWGVDMNLNYYVNYEYPLASEGWGATCDQILLRDGDIMTLGHFTGWSFYSDSTSIFNYIIADTDTVTQGDEVTLTLMCAGPNMGNTDGTAQNLVTYMPDVYCIAAEDMTSGDVTQWEYLGTAGEDGTLAVNTADLEAGTYVIAMPGQYGAEYSDEICSTPGGMILTVKQHEHNYENGTCTVCGESEPVTKYGIDVSGSYGTVEADKEEAAAGETVTLTVTPNEGYEFGYFEVLETTNWDTVSIAFTELGNNQYSFVMPAYGVKVTGIFGESAASVDAAGFVIKVNDVEMELVDGGSEACVSRYVSNLFRIVNVTVPYGTTTVTVERTNDEASPNIQYMSGTSHTFGGNAMPTFEADIVNYDGLCINCGGNYYHVKITEQEKPGEYQSITTDMAGDVLVTEQDMIEGWIPYYHAVVPRGSSYAYVTYPADTIYVYEGQAHVTEMKLDGSYSPDKFWPATENADGSVTVTLPIADILTEEPGTGTAPCFWKADGGEVLEGFTFSYAEDTSIFLVTLAAGNGYTTDGAGYVKTGEDYSFTVDIKNGYDAANMVVKVNGTEVTADDEGVYTVTNVTEDLVITVEGVEAIPTDGDVTFYFSVEEGDHFVEQGGVIWALEEVTVPYFDLAAYDMEYLYYNPDCYKEGQASQAPGTAETADGVVTMLHALIWLTEVYYNELDPADAGQGWLAENGWNGFSVYSATAGSAFFYMWDFGTNFNYYVNYEYPLGYPGWGATCDQIKLSDGDVISMRYNDNSGNVGTYHHFGKTALVTKTVNKGQSFDLELYRTGEDMANYTTPVYLVGEGNAVYLFTRDEIATTPTSGTLMATTDANGKVTIDTAELELGTYYLVSATSSPAVMLLTVESGEEPTPEYKSEYGITVMVSDAEMDLVDNGTETCGVLEARKLNVTVPAGTTEVTFVNITDTVVYGQMYVYSGAHDWTEYASNVTEATIDLAECGTSFCVSDSANNWYHVNIIVEEPAPEYKSEYGITVMVSDAEMDLVDNGTETCGVLEARKLNVNVPAGTTEVTFVNITDTVVYGQMYVYSGAHDWTEYASNVTEATIDLAECGTSFCVSDSANNWYHVNIIVEGPPHEHSYEAVVTAPTCTEDGYTTYICTCGDTYTADETEALGHTEETVSGKDATCTEPGLTDGVKCTVCGETLTAQEEIAALGHTDAEAVVEKEVAATCTENGSYDKVVYCSVCSEELSRETVITEATGHSWNGLKCDNCGASRENPFTDVEESEFYFDAVLWAVDNGITNGYGSDTIFAPEVGCTRGQIVTFLWRAAGEPEPEGNQNSFVDVESTDYYYKAVLWAVEEGITNGYGSDEIFNPDSICTRGQIATFLHRYFDEPASSGNNPFADVQEDAFYYNAVLWAVETGITNGYGSETIFNPDGACTRGQIVTFLYRALA